MMDNEEKNKKLFPQKLWDLVNEPRYHHCLRWSDDGERVYLDRDRLEQDYLATPENQFHTRKAISFVRQMNMYGFRKVDDHHYENENFRRDAAYLLKRMFRRVPIKDLVNNLYSNVSPPPAPIYGDTHSVVYGDCSVASSSSPILNIVSDNDDPVDLSRDKPNLKQQLEQQQQQQYQHNHYLLQQHQLQQQHRQFHQQQELLLRRQLEEQQQQQQLSLNHHMRTWTQLLMYDPCIAAGLFNGTNINSNTNNNNNNNNIINDDNTTHNILDNVPLNGYTHIDNYADLSSDHSSDHDDHIHHHDEHHIDRPYSDSSSSMNLSNHNDYRSASPASLAFVKEICDQRQAQLDLDALLEARRLAEHFLTNLIDDAAMIVRHIQNAPHDMSVSAHSTPVHTVDTSSLHLALKLMPSRLSTVISE